MPRARLWQRSRVRGVTDLDYLDLSNNLLSGRIPDCWNKYILLRLRNTSLYGKIPHSLENCTQLRLLDLGDNKLTGIIPPWIGERLDGLIVLRLRSNEFHGNIPSTLCLLLFLQVLDLSLNDTSGAIPSCLNKLTVMTYLWEGSFGITDDDNFIFSFNDHLLVVWKGFERVYGNSLGMLKSIDLSCNQLSGEIPRELASLEGLINLNLSRNMLRGSIIREIGQSKSLGSLDLSINNLSGEIPESMSEISFLSVMDLTNINLSGKIPSSTQLQSFNATSYSGNPGLCAEPLRKCPEDEPPKVSNNGGIERSSEGDEGLFERLVYNVTKFLEDHPGGDEVLLSASGKDATDDFEDVGHSSSARAMLDELYVGDIDASTIPTKTKYTPPNQPHYEQDKTSEFVVKLLQFLVPLLILGLAFGIRFYTKSPA
ncbi:hypothetical protein Gotri_013381 [Gossypium trilobum]|uniref:Cytochrome b5 heme-binding domain-containing protein n=1 Tax=Gossypium trilobum TaxID=34281 RepID=A0A7J9DTE1_9ROSI|nr:hypothetical protein [Gossypium trilobum]